MAIRFNKINGFVSVSNRTRYLIHLANNYLCHILWLCKNQSWWFLAFRKKFIILATSVCNKYKNNCYYNTFLEKGLYKLSKNYNNK